MTADRKTALVILDSGSPRRPDEVERFLLEVASDRRGQPLPWWREPFRPILAQARARRLGAAWRADLEAVTIDSPLERLSRAQAHGVAERLGFDGYTAALFGGPTIPDTVALMRSEGIERAFLLHVEPQTPDLGALARAAFDRSWCEAGGDSGALHGIDDFAATDDFIAIQAAHVAETLSLLRDPATPVLFLCRDPGRALARPELERRAAAQVEALAHRLRLGPRARLAWLPPRHDEAGFARDASAALVDLATEGANQVAMVPLGWVADRFETLYDIDMMLARRAREAGMRIFRVPTLNDRPEFLDALARFVQAATGTTESMKEQER